MNTASGESFETQFIFYIWGLNNANKEEKLNANIREIRGTRNNNNIFLT